jgi:hypothetical protein
MGLGHFDPSSGQVKGGVRKGSLILFDKRSGRTPWAAQVIPSESRQGHKSILIRFHGKSHDLTFEQAFAGVGLRGGARKELSAAARNIPAIAFLNAFSFLLPKAEARRLYHEAGARSCGSGKSTCSKPDRTSKKLAACERSSSAASRPLRCSNPTSKSGASAARSTADD